MSDRTNMAALVTGSTSGIGLACARALAKRGVNVIITGFGDEDVIKSLLDELSGFGVRADYVAADLSKLPELEALWSEVISLYPEGIDILVNNAGLQHWIPIDEFADDQWDKVIAVLLSAPFHLTKRCLPAMKNKGWGRIINIASVLGLVSMATCAHYSAAKHGVIGLTKGVALENASFGITCNAVCPGCTDTPLMRLRFEKQAASTGVTVEEVERSVIASIATGKLIETDQVAELVEFLCLSNASSQMTGATYLIDHATVAE